MKDKGFVINIDDIILTVVLLETFCSMRSVLRYAEKYLIMIGIVICLYKFIKSNTLMLSLESKIWFMFCAYVLVSIVWTFSVIDTIYYLRVAFFEAALIMVISNHSFVIKYLKIVKIGCLVAAVSIITEYVNPTIITQYFWFFFERHNTVNIAILKAADLYNGGYSGLIGEKGDAAYFMCLGLAIVISECFAKRKLDKFSVIGIVLLMIALLLTGKRMLLFISMALPVLLILISDTKKDKKISRMLIIAAAAIVSYFIIARLAPQIGRSFLRLKMQSGEDASLTERFRLWNICRQMFLSSPVLGYGLASFKGYSYLLGNQMAGANAHNIYLQLAGETGLAGCTILVSFLISTFIKDINVYRLRKYLDQDELSLMYFSFCGQFIFLVYGLSGNTFYYRFELTVYFVCLLMVNIIALQFHTILVRDEYG